MCVNIGPTSTETVAIRASLGAGDGVSELEPMPKRPQAAAAKRTINRE
jgi:hypothetical protein